MSNAIRLFICGSALRGQPDHRVLAGAHFLGAIRTAPRYRMHSVDDRHPAIYEVSNDGVTVLGELYELSPEQHRALLAQEPPNLYESDVVLEDGSRARAMLFPRRLVDDRSCPDISRFGGWAAYKNARPGRVALIGGTGAVGRAIARVLHDQGRAYRAIGRSDASLRQIFGDDSGADLRTWNADATSAATALEGVESAVYLVGLPYDRFELHPIVMRTTLEGALAAGVKRMLLIGTVYPYGSPQTHTVDETHPREPQAFNARMRKEQEDLLLAANGRGIETAVLRLPDLYGPGMEKSYLTAQFANAPDGKRSTMIGPVDVRHEWAFIPDCASVAVRVLDDPRAYGHFWNCGGPGEITLRQFSDKIYAVCDHKPNYFVVNKPMLRLFGIFNGEMRRFAEMNYLMSDPIVLNDDRLKRLLGDLPKTSYDEGIRLTLAGS